MVVNDIVNTPETQETARIVCSKGRRALFLQGDVSKRNDVEAMFAQAWEQAAYYLAGKLRDRSARARQLHDTVEADRAEQDNEKWHVLILDELEAAQGTRASWFRFRLLPQLIAFAVYQQFLLMRVQTDFRLLGYPGLAIVCFIAAALGGVFLLVNIYLQDRAYRRTRG